MSGMLLPLCETCSSLASCRKQGGALPSFPACHAPIRRLGEARARQLFSFWRERHGEGSEGERAMLEAVLARLSVDRGAYSDAFEPSFSWSEADGPRFFRFSYAFPGLRRAPAEAVEGMRALSAPLGEAARRAVEVALRAARSPAVSLVIFGYAGDEPSGPRAKVYLQMAEGAGAPALSLARALTGYRGPLSSEGSPLHLLGLDVGDEGLRGAKMYFLREAVPADEAALLLGGEPRALRRALCIHRLGGPHDRGAERVAEIDLSLLDNDLTWAGARESGWLAGYGPALSAFDQLASRFTVGVRRLSLSVAPARKLNVYYAIAEPAGG